MSEWLLFNAKLASNFLYNDDNDVRFLVDQQA